MIDLFAHFDPDLLNWMGYLFLGLAIGVSWEKDASEAACWAMTDEGLYRLFVEYYFLFQPNARKHLVWYRYNAGGTYPENVVGLFTDNPRIRLRIADLIDEQIKTSPVPITQGQLIGKGVDDGQVPPIRQSDYDSPDWRNANGNIDEVDWRLTGAYNPNASNTFVITIKDPYEWHDQEGRATQCIHAAFVRLKDHGAADYMTIGTGRVVLPPPTPVPTPPGPKPPAPPKR